MIQSDVALHTLGLGSGPFVHVDSVIGLVIGVALFGAFVLLLRRSAESRGGRR